MSEAKPFASLSSGLLARKGTARPAMRPQGLGHFSANMDDLGWNDMGHSPAPAPVAAAFAAPHDAHVPSPITALTPMGAGSDEERTFEPVTPVVEQQRAQIEASFSETAEAPFVLATKAKRPALCGEEEAEARQAESIDAAADEVAADATPEQPCQLQPILEDVPEPEAIVHSPVVPVTPKRRTSHESARAKAAFTLRLEAERHLKLRLACAVTGRSAQQLVTEALDQLLKSRPEIEALAGQLPGGAHQAH